MQVLEATVGQLANPWPLRRERAAELEARYPHTAEILRLYQAVVTVQEAAYLALLTPPGHEGDPGAGFQLEDTPEFAASQVLPGIVDVTVASGPARLRDGVISVFCTADLAGLLRRWLDHEALNPFETYLARASASPVLEALSAKFSLPGSRGRIGIGASTCPKCDGLPQLSYFAISGEALVTGPRYLVCSRCNHNWIFSRMTCASCGETDTARLPIYQEHERFPHARVDGCRSCHRYLLTFDLRRDTRCVPLVDELACLPLDLFAKDQGLSKVTPNLMGN
jgi:Protein involved in formate dehydrogenase formation